MNSSGAAIQERQEGVAFLLVEARRHEAVELPGQDREGQDHGPETRQLDLGEEELQRRGVDEFERAGGRVRRFLDADQSQQQIERAAVTAPAFVAAIRPAPTS